jgi:hypothetical protein
MQAIARSQQIHGEKCGLMPFSLLKETQINHWGKLSFRWYYWNILLKDRFSKEMEYFLPTRMSLRGKDRHYLREATP